MSELGGTATEVAAASQYLLGHSERELERLQTQARILEPVTRQPLIDAGLRPGMRVHDVGRGPGDVAFLAAELVGDDGQVVGTDRSADPRDRRSPGVYMRTAERLLPGGGFGRAQLWESIRRADRPRCIDVPARSGNDVVEARPAGATGGRGGLPRD